EGALRPFDRTRQALRSIGADLTACVHACLPSRFSRSVDHTLLPAMGWRVLGKLRVLALGALAIDAALIARVVSDRFDGPLPRFATNGDRILVVLGAAALLVIVADVLQLAVRNRSVRVAQRVELDIDVFFHAGMPPVKVLDISPGGVGLLFA